MAPERAKRAGRRVDKRARSCAATVEDDGVPQVYKAMLDEAKADDHIVEYRGVKRRRVGERTIKVEDVRTSDVSETAGDARVLAPQVIEDLDHESSDEELEWEEVDTLGIMDTHAPEETPKMEQPLSIVIGDPSNDTSRKTVRRRVKKPISATEKRTRLDVHKAHLLCLLFHTYQRNHWCNDAELQRILRRSLKLSPKLVQKLHPTVAASQFQKSNWLKEALKELSDLWRARFSVTRSGQTRASWMPAPAQPFPTLSESFLDFHDFKNKAKAESGSADYGAQLFCALLRGLGLETRLVSSLQPLPFATSAATVSPARSAMLPTVYAINSDDEIHSSSVDDTSPKAKVGRIARLGRRSNHNRVADLGITPEDVVQKIRPVARPRHPLFWVEVFDASYQTWISVDPIATGNVGKSLSLEPGMNDPENLLSYVLAFEDDNTARDVTRRYTKAYNAKTRKLRVECTVNGIKWYRKALRLFRRRRKLDRDLVEEAYFTQRDIQEGMPKGIEDFRGHPVYVLERHLYRDEALHPKHEIGKVGQNAKAATLSNIESVYRRQDVHLVKSADKWFRQGRKLKDGEQPLKYVKARKRQEVFEDVDSGQPETQTTLGLFAHFQTVLYVPPPITTDGLLPRNEFGNLDVYTRSMIPAGAVHVKSSYARQAARILGIDHVDAVTGFNFKGRQGTAVVKGVVIAAAHKDAMETTLNSISYTREQEKMVARRDRALALWRKFVLGLRIVESVKQYKRADESSEDEGSDDNYSTQQDLNVESNQFDNDVVGLDTGSASMLPEIEPFEIVDSIHMLPQAAISNSRKQNISTEPHDDSGGGGFIVEDDDISLNFVGARPLDHAHHVDLVKQQQDLITHEHSEDGDDGGGGFLVESPGVRIADPTTKKSNGVVGSPMHAVVAQPTDDLEPEHEHEPEVDDDPPYPETAEAMDDNADRQSLLSHDPDDDEVDPDWVD